MTDDKSSAEHMLTALYSGGFVTKPQTAERIAQAVIEEMVGQELAQSQGPLRIIDQGENWRVAAANGREWRDPVTGQVTMVEDPIAFSISKKDGRIVDYQSTARLKLDSEAQAIVRASLESKNE
ncbi:MAG TPA: hypothetical protein VKZ79_03665 [Alphaproteobacteria bacterium]|nr:hypothetical protein [Alphaproteobacteria bacterium]